MAEEGGITEAELTRGLAVGGVAGEPMVLVSAKAKREQALGRFLDALSDVLEDAKPLVKMAMTELEKQLEEERHRGPSAGSAVRP